MRLAFLLRGRLKSAAAVRSADEVTPGVLVAVNNQNSNQKEVVASGIGLHQQAGEEQDRIFTVAVYWAKFNIFKLSSFTKKGINNSK